MENELHHMKTGSTITEFSYDAWGRRRDKDDWSYTLTSEPALFADRGFTAHEFLSDFNLYNMNGRLYDPVVGRFLSPDPYIQDPSFSQSYNRYAYALNNPLKYNDPTGEKWRWGNPFYHFDRLATKFMDWVNKKAEPVNDFLVKHNAPAFGGGYNSTYGAGFYIGNNPMYYPGYEKRIATDQEGISDQIAGFSGMGSFVEQIWNNPVTRTQIPDFISIGIGFNGIVAFGGASSVELRWVTRGPEASFLPAITTTESIGGGYQIDAVLNIEGANYIGDVRNIRRQMLQTNSFTGDMPAFWISGGFTAGGKIGATGYFIPYEGSLIIGRELNIGFGLPAGLVPVNGAGGVSNTWILYDFYNYRK